MVQWETGGRDGDVVRFLQSLGTEKKRKGRSIHLGVYEIERRSYMVEVSVCSGLLSFSYRRAFVSTLSRKFSKTVQSGNEAAKQSFDVVQFFKGKRDRGCRKNFLWRCKRVEIKCCLKCHV